ncbi:Dyp-type peroxidase [Marinobacter caseinilyticus]|uniref:Dyp-type peroxidase n=1 Tax=Marinobacter caseinilyticus TaxID=2692195 RepID=UPI001408E843|nr:peroxidase [Marinobacter caseinilyticus]
MAIPDTLEFDDIQGLVIRGYGALPAACYLLLKIRDLRRARPWLRELTGQISYASHRPDEQAVNLAVTYHGLTNLRIEQTILERFSDEFRSGMTTPHKRRILGDEGDNAPEQWLWGGPNTTQVDLLLMCFGQDTVTLNTLCHQLRDGMTDHGLAQIARLDTEPLPDFKEHFGFRDSIGQPYIAEFDLWDRPHPNPVPLGEFLLGYPNGYGRFTQRPLVEPGQDQHNLLAADPEGSDQHDLGLNGTYLVFRQLDQDVPGFWHAMKHQAEATDHERADPVRIAAKLVGRWPSGTALVQSPTRDDPSVIDKDDFRYHRSDQEGLKCPLGAHIRRTHPRDSLPPEPGSEKSVAFSNRHRLLRRGRVYGTPFDDSLDPARFLDDLDREEAPVARGLHFICLNGNIGRQFEFVQHTWANNPNFNGLYQDPDPLVGARQAYGLPQQQFTIQQRPARCKLQDLPAFVQTRGGGYFFLPSRRALTFLFSPPANGRRPRTRKGATP